MTSADTDAETLDEADKAGQAGVRRDESLLADAVAESVMEALINWLSKAKEWPTDDRGLAVPSADQCDALVDDLTKASIAAVRSHDAAAETAKTHTEAEVAKSEASDQRLQLLLHESFAAWRRTVASSGDPLADLTVAAFEAGFRAGASMTSRSPEPGQT